MICLALHGILTGRSDVTWPEHFQVYAHRETDDLTVITDQYDAGPFPRLNWFLGNPKMARAQARRVAAWVADEGHERIALVGHSNGCDIIRRVALELDARGIAVEALIMVAPPTAPSIRRMGLLDPLNRGMIGRVVCYYTPLDNVLAPEVIWWNPLTWISRAVRWPYGNAGRVGIDHAEVVYRDAPAPPQRVFNRVWPRYRHTTYFAAENQEHTFATIIGDIDFAPTTPITS